jgi:hypothetical protein
MGITTGTTATTYDPAANVSRLQMAAFLSRSVDGVLKRGSRRAAINKFWTPQNDAVVALTSVGVVPGLIACDGADLWSGVAPANVVVRVRGSDGNAGDLTGRPCVWRPVRDGRIFVMALVARESLPIDRLSRLIRDD